MGSSCCEFICLDGTLTDGHENRKPLEVRKVLVFSLGLAGMIVVMSCCICFCKRIKTKHVQSQPAEDASKLAFSEDLYLKMSVEMIEKNEEITDLRKRIAALESQLNGGERSKKTTEQILRINNDSWKDAYDLHVNIRD